MGALRTALAAIANAEAPPAPGAAAAVPGRLVEHPRLVLSDADLERIVRHEIDDRHDTIAAIGDHDRPSEVDELRAEVSVLERYLD